MFAALLALFLQLALTTVTSAALPETNNSSLLADLAIVCTPNGAEHQDGAPSRPGACDHCTLCPSFNLGATLPSLASVPAPVITDQNPPTGHLASLVASPLDHPTSRGPPSFHI